MADEPTYNYVRGTGWVPCYRNHEWETRRIGPYLVTCEIRKPVGGEQFWFITHEEDLDFVFGIIQEDYKYRELPPRATPWEDSYSNVTAYRTCVISYILCEQ